MSFCGRGNSLILQSAKEHVYQVLSSYLNFYSNYRLCDQIIVEIYLMEIQICPLNNSKIIQKCSEINRAIVL